MYICIDICIIIYIIHVFIYLYTYSVGRYTMLCWKLTVNCISVSIQCVIIHRIYVVHRILLQTLKDRLQTFARNNAADVIIVADHLWSTQYTIYRVMHTVA